MQLAISGYVLAGGKSSRMGQDKALLELEGRPLIELAAKKLRAVCREVHILSDRPELEPFGPLVKDLHPGCGPLGGIEAALLHATSEWSLFLPVDMPFLTTACIDIWMQAVVAVPFARIAFFIVGGRPQPTFCMLHRQVLPFVQEAIEQERFKLYPVLKATANSLALVLRANFQAVLLETPVAEGGLFANLNTPEEFVEAQERWAANAS